MCRRVRQTRRADIGTTIAAVPVMDRKRIEIDVLARGRILEKGRVRHRNRQVRLEVPALVLPDL
jgi:hypothetical protein